MSKPPAQPAQENPREVRGILKSFTPLSGAWGRANVTGGEKIMGTIPHPQVGMEYIFRGAWSEHAKYGRQFKFDSFELVPIDGLDSVRAFLDRAPWINKKIAKALTDAYGADALKVCKEDPARVAREINWITLERAMEIQDRLPSPEEAKVEADFLALFARTWIKDRLVGRIWDTLGEEGLPLIRANPYMLVERFEVSFSSADKVAANVQMAGGKDFSQSAERIRAGVLCAFEDAAHSGHTCLPLEGVGNALSLVLGASHLLAKAPNGEIVAADLRLFVRSVALDMITEGVLVEHEGVVALKSVYLDELAIAERLMQMSGRQPSPTMPNTEELEDDQEQALKQALQYGVYVLTGAAGTGKTHLVRSIVDTYVGADVKITAPTGKAAKRVQELTEGRLSATTIHRLLEPDKPREKGSGKFQWNFQRTKENPIEASLVVVDEASMVDTWLMARLLEALAPGTKLILCGDHHQLPSVGAGNVLRDLLESKQLASDELTEIKRNKGFILRNAHHVRKGEDIELDFVPNDFFFIETESEEDIEKAIVNLLTKVIPVRHNVDPVKDVQVLVPRRTESDGHPSVLVSPKLNVTLQAALNPSGVRFGTFRLGDKVIQTKNSYEALDTQGQGVDLLNGDVGEVVDVRAPRRSEEWGDPNQDEQDPGPPKCVAGEIRVNPGKMRVEFSDPSRRIDLDPGDPDVKIELAYALTVHKAQGSEWPVVVIPLHYNAGQRVLQRSWLYTALTRAKIACYLVGQRRLVPSIVTRVDQHERHTQLRRLLRAQVPA